MVERPAMFLYGPTRVTVLQVPLIRRYCHASPPLTATAAVASSACVPDAVPPIRPGAWRKTNIRIFAAECGERRCQQISCFLPQNKLGYMMLEVNRRREKGIGGRESMRLTTFSLHHQWRQVWRLSFCTMRQDNPC